MSGEGGREGIGGDRKRESICLHCREGGEGQVGE